MEKNEKLAHGVLLGAETGAVTYTARLARSRSRACFAIVLIQVTAEKKGSHLFLRFSPTQACQLVLS